MIGKGRVDEGLMSSVRVGGVELPGETARDGPVPVEEAHAEAGGACPAGVQAYQAARIAGDKQRAGGAKVCVSLF
jgi:hypothetical protein